MNRFIRSVRYAFKGIAYCLKNEKNFRIQILFAMIAAIGGLILGLTPAEWILIIICIAMVLSFEMINTAVEHICNHFHPEIHERIRIIKDISAGAVLISAILAATCGAIVFIPKILNL